MTTPSTQPLFPFILPQPVSTETPEEDRRLLGRVIAGKLRIVEHLGSGSMGRVYRAHHLSLDKDVAIKVLRESAVPDPNRSRRFEREARAASRLNHPNSVAVLDFGEDGEDKLLYIAMEFLEGEDLQEIIDRGTLLGVERICHIMIQVLAALAAAHDAEIIHRDMKPSNIVLVRQRNDEGQITEVVKVCDFGVAKFLSGGRDTLDGGRAQRVIGTPLYMSPEQAVGDALDPRTDVYSCGVIMFEMLTGQPPFTAETPMGVLMKHVSEPVRKPSSLVPNVPPELEAIMLWSLEKSRDKRPGSARELRNALRAFLHGKASTLPALSKYGIETINEDPWVAKTPHWQLGVPALPSTSESPILAAPPLPSLVGAAGRAEEAVGAVVGAAFGPAHFDLVADLELQGGAGSPDPERAERTGRTERTERARRANGGDVLPLRPRSGVLLGRPLPGAGDVPDLSERVPEAADRAAPPRGAQVPVELRASTVDTSTSPVPSPWDERSEIFSEQSYFAVKKRTRDRVTIDLDEVRLDAPPPRSLSRADETDPKAPAAARDGMAAYLWERFGLSPDRQAPPDGFWIRDAQGREVGPCTWSEITQALRMEALYDGVCDVSLSSDQKTWISAERFVQLTGVEAILRDDEPLPDDARGDARPRGTLRERSIASVFSEVSQRRATGRLAFNLWKGRRRARFDIDLDEGRPTFVLTNEPHLQLPNLLVVKGVIPEDKLALHIRTVLAEATTLEDAVSRNAKFDVAQYRAAVMKERLRHLLRWPEGAFAFDPGARPSSRTPFAVSLLALLPDLVYRTLSAEQLERELEDLLDRPFVRAADAGARLADMGLTRSQRGVAERLLTSSTLRRVLPAEGRIRKAYTTMAYVLREAGLFEAADPAG